MRSLSSLSILVLAGCLLPVIAVPAVARDGEPPTDARVIELEADAALRFTQDGEQVFDIPVVPGETVVFRIDNSAGFDHTFYIGTEEELAVPDAATGVGIAAWSSGVRELVWEVPDDVDGLRFGCTVPGHYSLMQGCFSEARVGPDGAVERVEEAVTCTLTSFDREWRAGGRVEVPAAGIAVTFPHGWEVSVGSDPDPTGAPGLVEVLSARRGSYPAGSSCAVFADDEVDLDWGAAAAGSDAVIELGEGRALRFDEVNVVGSVSSYSSTFLVDQPGSLVTLVCESAAGLQDDWLSIIRSFEALPAEQ